MAVRVDLKSSLVLKVPLILTTVLLLRELPPAAAQHRIPSACVETGCLPDPLYMAVQDGGTTPDPAAHDGAGVFDPLVHDGGHRAFKGVRQPGSTPFDLAIAHAIRSSGVQESGTANAVAGVFRLASLPGTIIVAAGLYGLGEATEDENLSDLGMRSGQAIIGAGITTLAGKLAFGRARPRIAPEDPYDVAFGRGFEGDRFQSFPSAHTAAAFASATVLAAELADETGAWIYPSTYVAATLAGMSRLFHEEHWVTDVLAGAVIGVLGGAAVLEYHD